MSTYDFQVLLEDGQKKEGRRTARTMEVLRVRLEEECSVKEWIRLERVSPDKLSIAKKKEITPSPKLAKLLFLQSGRCFFCGEPLKTEEASIEHLNPKSKGGTNKEDNLVVCHKGLNTIFADMDLKRKFELVLRSDGSFRCPGGK